MALNKSYTVTGATKQTEHMPGGTSEYTGYYYPDMRQLTDGVFEADNATNLLDLKEGTYVGFHKDLGNATFEIELDNDTISEVKVHYRVQAGTDDGVQAPGAIKCRLDGGTTDYQPSTIDTDNGVHTAVISVNATARKVKLSFDYRGNTNWCFISEIEIFVSRDEEQDPRFRVQYYGYVDEIKIIESDTASTAAAPPNNGMHTMALNPNLPQMGAKSVTNVAEGKMYKYSKAPYSGYSDGGVADEWHTGLLTNNEYDQYEAGLRPTGVLNGYVGYTSSMTDYTVTVDLGNKFNITSASIDLYWHDGSYLQPTKLECAYSADENTWTSGVDIKGIYTERSVGHYYNGTTTYTRTAKKHTCSTQGTGMRYVMFTISTPNRLMIDEIDVRGEPVPASNWALTGQYKGTNGTPGSTYGNGGYGDEGGNDVWGTFHAGKLNNNGIRKTAASSDAGSDNVGIVKPSGNIKITFQLTGTVNVTGVKVYSLFRKSGQVKHYLEGISVSVGATDNPNAATSLGSDSTIADYSGECKMHEVTSSQGVDGQYVFIEITPAADSTGGFITNITEIQIWGTETSPPPQTEYNVTVNNGTGDGTYDVGSAVSITANAPAEEMTFDYWSGNAEFTDANSSTTTFIMPAHDVTVTANYKDRYIKRLENVIDTRFYKDGRSFYGNMLDGNNNPVATPQPGGKLPKNDTTTSQGYELVTIPLEGIPQAAYPVTETKLTKLYRDNYYYKTPAPDVAHVNILATNTDWELSKIWKLKSNKSPESTDESDWDVFTGTSAELMAKAFGSGDGKIDIADGDVIRLVFAPNNDTYTQANTHFFDYDISSGLSSEGIYPTSTTSTTPTNITHGCGINEPWPLVDFRGSDPKTTGKPFLAFGNCNTGMPYADPTNGEGDPADYLLWNGQMINGYNWNNNRPDGANGCTFGLVKDHLLPAEGKVGYNETAYKYNNGLDFNVRTNEATWVTQWKGTANLNDVPAVPAMFKLESTADSSKRRYFTDMPITFDKKGDMYTIKSVKSSSDSTIYAENLNRFKNTAGALYSNNFWPMDEKTDSTDCGNVVANDPMFGDNYENGPAWSTEADKWKGHFPNSDDGEAHNSYFGLNFDIGFSLTNDYVGPLNYFFFGDDDMFVYLDGVLVCDIGGVHSSIGEYVNLWDTLSPYSTGDHTLSIFYTERGASGSSCYMRFNLPGVTDMPDPAQVGYLLVEKEVEEIPGYISPAGTKFKFEITLTNEDNSAYTEKLPIYIYNDYTRYYAGEQPVMDSQLGSAAYNAAGNVATVELENKQYAVIKNLPIGTRYTVQEVQEVGFNYGVTVRADRLAPPNGLPPTAVPSGEGTAASNYTSVDNTHIAAKNLSRVHFLNKYPLRKMDPLPSTGGVGREVLPVVGLTAVIFSSLAPVVLRDKSNRKQRRAAK